MFGVPTGVAGCLVLPCSARSFAAPRDRWERLLDVALRRAVLGLMSPGAAGPGDNANIRRVFQYFQPPKSGPRDYHETLVGSSYTRFGSITQALSPRRPYIILIQPSLSLCLSVSLSLSLSVFLSLSLSLSIHLYPYSGGVGVDEQTLSL